MHSWGIIHCTQRRQLEARKIGPCSTREEVKKTVVVVVALDEEKAQLILDEARLSPWAGGGSSDHRSGPLGSARFPVLHGFGGSGIPTQDFFGSQYVKMIPSSMTAGDDGRKTTRERNNVLPGGKMNRRGRRCVMFLDDCEDCGKIRIFRLHPISFFFRVQYILL